jgi:hypothetical protein
MSYTNVVPEMDALVYSILPNFRNSSITAETSLKNAVADLSRENTRKYQESFAEKQVTRNTSIHPILDRSIGLTVPNFRSSSRPEENSLKNALAQLGTEKAGRVIAANKAFQQGNFDAVEYYLGRPLSQEEKTKKELTFIRETKVAKIKSGSAFTREISKTQQRVDQNESQQKQQHADENQEFQKARERKLVDEAAAMARLVAAAKNLRANHSGSKNNRWKYTSLPGDVTSDDESNASHSSSASHAVSSTVLAPTVLRPYAPTLQQLAASSSSGPYAVAQGPPGSLPTPALDEISRIRNAGGPYHKQISAINLVLGSEQKDEFAGIPSITQLKSRLGTLGYTGKGISSHACHALTAPLRHPAYRENVDFGKYTIDKKKLGNNIVSFNHKSGPGTGSSARRNHTITGLPAFKVSDAFRGVILEILNDMPVNLNVLNDKEMEQFRRIIKASKKNFNSKLSNNQREALSALAEDEQMNRLSILIGELSAGNTSKALKTELSQTLNSLNKAGLISAKQVIDATKRYIKVF